MEYPIIPEQEARDAILSLLAYEDHVSSSLSAIFGRRTIEDLVGSLTTPKFTRAMDEPFSFVSPPDISVKIRSANDTYTTTLNSCTCKTHPKPCKHMIWLAITLGALLVRRDKEYPVLVDIENKTAMALAKEANVARQQKAADEREERWQKKCEEQEAILDDKIRAIHSATVTYPWLADLFNRYDEILYRISQERLNFRGAEKSAEEVRNIRLKTRNDLAELQRLRIRLFVYEQLFPWLKLVQEANISPDDAVRISAYINEDEDYITFLRKILTMEEYTTLSPAEKFMCAVEHCRKNKPPEK